MEFFLPSLVILILAGVTSFVIIPRMGPMIVLVLSLALLAFGMYHHYKLFSSEYRLSTWQEQLKFYAPGVAIAALVFFILFFVVSLFKGGQVPVPNMPSPAITANNSTLSPVASILNTVKNTVSSAAETVSTVAESAVNTVSNAASTIKNTVSPNKNSRNIRPSFFNKV
jgi:hypothetical protein